MLWMSLGNAPKNSILDPFRIYLRDIVTEMA